MNATEILKHEHNIILKVLDAARSEARRCRHCGRGAGVIGSPEIP